MKQEFELLFSSLNRSVLVSTLNLVQITNIFNIILVKINEILLVLVPVLNELGHLFDLFDSIRGNCGLITSFEIEMFVTWLN